MAQISQDELPNRAFQLAYFLHRERTTALEIAVRALNKLQLAATAQGKRLYYRLTGRSDAARKARSKVSVEEPHLLQRLVYVESEEFERRKEAAAQNSNAHDEVTPACHSDLVVFFIKHLVRITTRRNSFYVTLGLGRLLYNYTTPETMELYNLVIQDPDRVHDDYYYRSRKGVLLKELKERFGELIEVMKGPRGEQRWRTGESNSGQAELVRECLTWFTPWSTPCVVPERFNPLNDPIEKLTFAGRHPDDEHEVEVNRIHAALHPDCFARLAAANGLTAPDERLELPHFFLADAHDDSDQDSRRPPNLSEEDLNTINNLLAQEAGRRKAASSGFLRVLVDGTEMAEINTQRSASARFAIPEEAEVVEVYGRDEQGPLLLATHLLNFNGPTNRDFTITAEGGQRISFAVQLLRDHDGSAGAQLAVTYAQSGVEGTGAKLNQLSTSIFNAVRDLSSAGWWKPAAAFSALVLLFAGAWWVWSDRQNQNNVVSVAPTPAPSVPLAVTPEPSKSNEAQLAADYPEKKATPGANAATPTPLLARREPNETFVSRTLMTDNDVDAEPGAEDTRGPWNRNSTGKSLADVRRVYVQMKSSAASSAEFQTELRKALATSNNLQPADADQADAALKVTARAASTRPEDPRIIVIVRAVNADGYVVWPATRRSSTWRYMGRPRYVAERIVADLAKDKRSGKGR
ncbi:MAG TPA: hypothetical protein VFZ40_09560 [Pyrinomonadaceae bacterium]